MQSYLLHTLRHAPAVSRRQLQVLIVHWTLFDTCIGRDPALCARLCITCFTATLHPRMHTYEMRITHQPRSLGPPWPRKEEKTRHTRRVVHAGYGYVHILPRFHRNTLQLGRRFDFGSDRCATPAPVRKRIQVTLGVMLGSARA